MEESPVFAATLAQLPRYASKLKSLREIILANLAMIAEIPSPTFGEEKRVTFLRQRFSECGLESSTDQTGNGIGLLPGLTGKRNILLVGHADTNFSEKVDHTITIQGEHVLGPGVTDNSLGLAALASLPDILETLGIKFKSNLILMGGVRSLGRGNLEGLRFFLANNKLPIHYGLCVEGVQLGRLSLDSIGMCRGEVNCSVSDDYDWTRFGVTSAIVTLNEVINRMIEIPVPRRPRTNIFMGSIEGGKSFNTVAMKATLGFEIRSEDGHVAEQIAQQIQDIAAEVSSRSDADVSVDIFASRQVGGISFSHPLARRAREVLKALGIEPRSRPSTSELAAFLDQRIPAITIGLSKGARVNDLLDSVAIEPIFTGLAQLIGILQAIDEGLCDEY
jgi:acetylornithine deacetylase/succinyl-diaminopimelate desuccinylase-like protein